jgi:hypothetical protein
MLVAALTFVLLLAVAFAHLLWAMGNTWPIRDPALLARTVIGTAGVARVPRGRALLVGLGTLVAGVIALALADKTGGGPGLTALGVVLALAFAARGAIGYTRWWQQRTPEEPFRSLDRRNYSPLCLALAIGYLALVLMRLT